MSIEINAEDDIIYSVIIDGEEVKTLMERYRRF